MGQIKGFWRDSWWMWSFFMILAIVMGTYVMAFFYFMVPILIGIFCYFAFMRYDKQGKDVGGKIH